MGKAGRAGLAGARWAGRGAAQDGPPLRQDGAGAFGWRWVQVGDRGAKA